MAASAIFLHVTDPHIAGSGTSLPLDDHKVDIPAVEQETRERALDLLFGRLAERLTREGRSLDGILFGGDALDRGRPGGHASLLEMFLKHSGRLGITAGRIVAVLGNHDVPRGSPPSSRERYQAFLDVWGTAGCVVPWLDGVDPAPVPKIDSDRHRLLDFDKRWVVFAMNTSNWSHVTQTLPQPLQGLWNELPSIAAKGDAELERKLRGQLDSLAQYDMTRVSPAQLEALRTIMEATPLPPDLKQLRFVLMHHHLRAPSLREELKPFADMSNLEQVRGFFRQRKIDIAVHGHKHEHAAQFDHIYDPAGDSYERTLVISGGTFDASHEMDAVRLITIEGLPSIPIVRIESIPLARPGSELIPGRVVVRRLSDPSRTLPGAPTVVQGNDIDLVYQQACEAAENEASLNTLIVHLDISDDDQARYPFPTDYPAPKTLIGDEKQIWFQDLVKWWQLDRSRLEDRIPYVHGARLRRYGGVIDQIARVIDLLRAGPTTRALAILVDPFRDFSRTGGYEEFASFCLVEFKRRDLGRGQSMIDCIAFYRAQEFARWWPINVAELRQLQRDIGNALGFKAGRITTITAEARTHSKSPTQVAMPIIDRWLDQAPERIYLLANILIRRKARNPAEVATLRGYLRSLSDLKQATESYNPDGMPIPIEGLEMLSSYISATHEGGASQLKDLTDLLRSLASHNRSYERARGKPEFDNWAPTAARYVDDLEKISENIVSSISG